MKKKIKIGYVYKDKQFVEVEIVGQKVFPSGNVEYLCKLKNGILINKYQNKIFLTI